MATIRCRAQVAGGCHQLKGFDEYDIYDGPQDEDGTWRRSDDTVVCTPCYVVLGAPDNAELELAIASWKEAHAQE